MIGPIRQLEDGAARIGAGQFDHRIELATGDEFEQLATRFNEMAVELSVSQERSLRIARLKRFLAPQVAELVDRTGDDRVLDGRRVEVVVVFCDLRGFTAFSARADTETIIGVLREYYDALERAVNAHEATLVNFSGDGAMVLVNAPVSRPDPALRAVIMASDMQKGVQKLLAGWRSLNRRLGFGIGLAMGPATVGRIGSEGRLDYTAIGNVVESRFATVFERGRQPDPRGPGRRPGDRFEGASRRTRCAGVEGVRPAGSRVCRLRIGCACSKLGNAEQV